MIDKLSCIALVLSCCFLLGCNKNDSQSSNAVLMPSGNEAKIETAVVYMKSNSSRKINLDAFFMESKETIYFKAQEPPLMPTSVWVLDDVEVEFDQGKLSQRFQILVDRENGVLCFEKKCANIKMICPSKEDERKKEICKYFK
ncbi:hypothetical protein [Paracidovorax avenae]|uniref:hypothetical protein n=1 Tax=Paracidovorax avenae TaxID=80867 RepID=UPI000FE238EB|nr:hypothetical protein [Paracidovorax avenae]